MPSQYIPFDGYNRRDAWITEGCDEGEANEAMDASINAEQIAELNAEWNELVIEQTALIGSGLPIEESAEQYKAYQRSIDQIKRRIAELKGE